MTLRLPRDSSPRLALFIATLILLGLLSYINDRSSLLERLTRADPSLWTPWPKETPVFELIHHSIDGEGLAQETLIGVMRLIETEDRLIQQLEMRVKTTHRSTVVQRELTLSYHSAETEASEARPYTLRWQELNLERGSWWNLSQTQWSTGEGEVYPMSVNRSNLHKGNPMWCRRWTQALSDIEYLPNLPKGSIAHKKSTECSETYPLPKGAWVWQVKPRQQSKVQLFDERSGMASGILHSDNFEGRDAQGQHMIEKVFHLREGHELRGELQHELHYSEGQLQRWVELQGGIMLWSARRTLWDGQYKQVDPRNWLNLQSVQMIGNVLWARVRTLNLDLNAPLKPINEPWQIVSENPSSSQFAYNLFLKRAARPLLKNAKGFSTLTLLNKDKIEQNYVDRAVSEILTRLKQHDGLHDHQHSHQTISLERIVKASMSWMKEELSYALHSGSPSAELTVRRGSGDCNELSQVFVEIMRLMGIKSQMVFGITHQQDNAWGYHAWARVSDGVQWYEVDPSKDLHQLSPAYISFAVGDLEQQTLLQRLIGRTSGRVIHWSK